jgi:toxin ParE1/3/4
MPRSKTFRFRKKADEDLANIYIYSYRTWGADRAEEYIRDLNSAFQALADNSRMGRDYGYVRPAIRAYAVESHIIFYQPTGYGISVVRVLHNVMDHKRHL